MDKKYIRFIDSNYNTLFHVPSGGFIRIKFEDGDMREYPCRYIDQTHAFIGRNVFHICEFAELMERNGRTYEPVKEIGDLDFYRHLYLDREHLGHDGKPVPYYELLTWSEENKEFRLAYCPTPKVPESRFCLMQSDHTSFNREFYGSVCDIPMDQSLATRVENIVRAIRDEQTQDLSDTVRACESQVTPVHGNKEKATQEREM